jgi:putative ABC transport system permease protein
MVLAESVLLLLIGGVIGLGIATALIPVVAAGSGLGLPPVGAGNWVLGIVLMAVIGLVVGVIPAVRAMRLNIVDALAGR